MTYHAIGKKRWDALPKLFANPGLAGDLIKDMKWWSCSNMFPHKFYPATCIMYCGISFNKSTQMFTKYVQLKEIKYGQ